jgi:hypothetical protein
MTFARPALGLGIRPPMASHFKMVPKLYYNYFFFFLIKKELVVHCFPYFLKSPQNIGSIGGVTNEIFKKVQINPYYFKN